MNTKERLLAALRSKKVDRVPMIIEWNEETFHKRLSWSNERQRLELHRANGWDAYLRIHPLVSPLDSVHIEKTISTEDGNRILRQAWHTPEGVITEALKATDDWIELLADPPHIQFMSDFRTARYIEFPFKKAADLQALEYLFPVDNPSDKKKIMADYQRKRQLADEFEVPLIAYLDSGMDWLLWFYSPEVAVLKMMDEPEFMREILFRINRSKHQRLDLLLSLGIDGVMKRGWYESADIWSPSIFREHAIPVIEEEIDMTHRAGIPYIYVMDTGIAPLLPDLASLDFDCLYGADPVLGRQDLGELKRALPGKAVWGGLSGPGHFGASDPEIAYQAVENALRTWGKTGLILGMAASFRHYWSWENFEAAERAWKRDRDWVEG